MTKLLLWIVAAAVLAGAAIGVRAWLGSQPSPENGMDELRVTTNEPPQIEPEAALAGVGPLKNYLCGEVGPAGQQVVSECGRTTMFSDTYGQMLSLPYVQMCDDSNPEIIEQRELCGNDRIPPEFLKCRSFYDRFTPSATINGVCFDERETERVRCWDGLNPSVPPPVRDRC